MDKQIKLVNQLKRKDPKALSVLYQNYSGSLYGIVFRILKNQQASEEILQQTFLKIWNNIDQFDESRSSLFTWMRTIAKNTSIDKLRLKSFQRHQETISTEDLVHDHKSTRINQNKIDVDNLMSLLDEKYRLVLNKVYLEGFSHSDVAKEFDLPIGTVKTRIRKAIQILREELKDEKVLFLGFLILSLLIFMLWH